MADITFTIDASLAPFVQQATQAAAKAKDMEDGLKRLGAALKETAANLDKVGKVTAEDTQRFQEWRRAAKAFEEGAAAGEKFTKTVQMQDFYMASGKTQVKEKAAGVAQLAGQWAAALGVGAAFHRTLDFVSQSLRQATERIREQTAAIPAYVEAQKALTKPAAGQYKLRAGAQALADSIATATGLTVEQATGIVGQTLGEGLGADTARSVARASAVYGGALGDPAALIETIKNLRVNFPREGLSGSELLNQLLGAGQRPDQVLGIIQAAGLQAGYAGSSSAELIALASELSERTTPKMAAGAVRSLASLMAKGVDLGHGQQLSFRGLGFGQAEALFRTRAPQQYAEALADPELGAALGLIRGGAIGRGARDVLEAGQSGAPLERAEREFFVDPLAQAQRRVSQEKARTQIADRAVTADQLRFDAEYEALQRTLRQRGVSPLGIRYLRAAFTEGIFGAPPLLDRFGPATTAGAAADIRARVEEGQSLADALRGSEFGSTGTMVRLLEAIASNTGANPNARPAGGPELRQFTPDREGLAP